MQYFERVRFEMYRAGAGPHQPGSPRRSPVRFLEDFHEPTLATLRRRKLPSLDDDADPDEHRAAGEVVATTFLLPMHDRQVDSMP